MLNSKQRAFLKKISNDIEALVRIGKNGIDDNLIESINNILNKREIVKIKVLQNADVELREVAEKIATKTNSELVYIIGKTMIYYKENREKPKLSLELKGI